MLDGIDHQKGASPTLLPALARLGDMVSPQPTVGLPHLLTPLRPQIPNLSVLLVLKSPPRPMLLQKSGIPYVHFPPYTRQQIISIVAKEVLVADGLPPVPPEEGSLARWYGLFATTVYDALVGPTSRSLPIFRAVCSELWPRFLAPFVAGESPPGGNGHWTFSKLVVRNRVLFQYEGECTLGDSIIPHEPTSTTETPQAQKTSSKAVEQNSNSQAFKPPLIPHGPALVLTSAYLASHTPPRLDVTLFSRLSSASKRGTRHRKRKMMQSPSKHGHSGITSSHRVLKSSISINADLPRPFPLERLLAIFRAIHPAGVKKRPLADQVYAELATLEKLRLVVPASGGPGAGLADTGERWRVNVDKDWVGSVGSRFGIRLDEWVVDDGD